LTRFRTFAILLSAPLALVLYLLMAPGRSTGWMVERSRSRQIPSSREVNRLEGVLFLNDIHRNYRRIVSSGEPIHTRFVIPPAAVTVLVGRVERRPSGIRSRSNRCLLALLALRKLLGDEGATTLSLDLRSRTDLRIEAYEIHSDPPSREDLTAMGERVLKEKFLRPTFSAIFPASPGARGLNLDFSRYSIKSRKNNRGIILVFEGLGKETPSWEIRDIFLQSPRQQVRASFPRVDYFKQEKTWMKSLFIPGNTTISYAIQATGKVRFDGYMGAFPREAPVYTIKVNGETIITRTVRSGTSYFSRELAPVEDRLEIEIRVGNRPDLTGILGNLCFHRPQTATPNTVLYLVDALRGDFAGIEDNGFESFFRTDTICRNAFANGTWTADSLPSLFSGKFKRELVDAPARSPNLGEEELMLAEYLKSRGYTTAAFIGNSFLVKSNAHQGFDHIHFCWTENRKIPVYPEPDRYRAFKYGFLDEALRAFSAKHHDKKLFIFLHTMETHDPYELPRGMREYARGIDPDVLRSVHGKFKRRLLPPTRPQIEALRALYRDEVKQAFRFFKRTTDHLRRRGILNDRSMLLLTSDHGERFYEHGAWVHGRPDLYDEVLRIPLMIRCPGLAAGRIEDNVQLVDVYPTIREWLGDVDGKDLSGLSLFRHGLSPSPFGTRWIYADGCQHPRQYCAIRGRFKVIVSGEDVQVFDLRLDPRETRNLAREPRHRDLIESARLFRRRLGTRRRTGRAVHLSREQTDRLKSLGYLE